MGSGITLLVSAGILAFGEDLSFSTAELYGMSGALFVALGVLFGIGLVVSGYR